MKKQQYIAAVACLVAGAIGFASVYATEKNQEKRNDSDYAIQQESTEQLSAASYEIKPKTDKQAENAPEVEEDAVKVSEKEKSQTEATEEKEDNEKKTEKTETVATAAENSLHFDTKTGMQWPLEGEILLARGVLIDKKAVCEGYAAAFKAFMDELSIPCKLVSGKASSNGDFTGRVNHAWNRVEVGGVWYQIDVTWDDPVPDQKGKVRYKYFLLSEEEMNKTHLQVRNEKKI